MRRLESIEIRNFKSIRDQKLALEQLNVLIGGNGSGKSNFVGVFGFLKQVAAQQLQLYTGVASGADKILHFGRRRSPSLDITLEFSEGHHANGYSFSLIPTTEDRFVFQQEAFWFHDRYCYPQGPKRTHVGSGHEESRLPQTTVGVEGWVRADLERFRIYHFHDTSSVARVKQTGSIEDNKTLHTDAGNLAAFLYRLKSTHIDHYNGIEATVRQIAPFFDRFALEPSRTNPDTIRLEWLERGSDITFDAHALSDGTLRFVCLATLFLQPQPPAVILIDEPELGLHPAAITLLASLLQSAATRAQVLAATHASRTVLISKEASFPLRRPLETSGGYCKTLTQLWCRQCWTCMGCRLTFLE